MRFPILGGSLLAGGSVVQALVGFGANLLLVRHLSPEEFGSFALAMAAVSTTFTIVSLRLVPLIIRDPQVDAQPDLKRMYIGAAIGETAVASTASMLAVALLDSMTTLSVVLVFVAAGNHLLSTMKAFYERRLPLAELAAVETTASLISHGATVLLVLVGVGMSALYIRELIALIATAVGLRAVAGLPSLDSRMPHAGEWKELLRRGRDMWLDGVLEGLIQRVTIMLAAWFGGARDAGFFFQAQRLSMVPQQILFPLVARTGMLWLSRLSSAEARRAGRNKLLLATAAILGITAIATIVFADPIVPLLFGEAWRFVAELLIWLSGMILFSTLFEILRVFCVVNAQTSILLIGRAVQYAIGALGLGAWLLAGTGSVVVLAAVVSCCYAGAFGVMFLLLRVGPSRVALGG